MTDAPANTSLRVDRGGLSAYLATDPMTIRAAQQLRAKAFGRVPDADLDCDKFDAQYLHFVVEHRQSGRLVCTFRVGHFPSGQDLSKSYSAQFYDLSVMQHVSSPLAEMGRFCIDPTHRDGDVLRVAWGVMTAFVDAHAIGMLFGCASFFGTDPLEYLPALRYLQEKAAPPAHLAPRVKSPEIVRFSDLPNDVRDDKMALRQIPPLLRTYLTMGGWVSDHAVIDRHLGTFHVLTAVEIAAIPPTRKRLLRALA